MSVNESIGSAASRPVNAQGGQAPPQAVLSSTAEMDAKRGRIAAALVRAALFSDIITLMAATPAYHDHPLRNLEWLLRPPIDLNQFTIYRDLGGRLIAFVAWAFMSEAVEQRSFRMPFKLAPADWRSGDRPWVILRAAPFGDNGLIDEDLRFGKLARGRFRINQKAGGKITPGDELDSQRTPSDLPQSIAIGNDFLG